MEPAAPPPEERPGSTEEASPDRTPEGEEAGEGEKYDGGEIPRVAPSEQDKD